MHAARRTRPEADDDQALYPPEASRFSGLKHDTLYRWRKKTQETGRQYGPVFAFDQSGRPFYTRAWLLDFRRADAISRATKARKQ